MDPFAGLSERRPVRLIAALRCELAKGADVALPWTRFLHIAAGDSDKPKIAVLIARRLDGLPAPVLEAIMMPASYWLARLHKRLVEHDPIAFWSVFDKLTNTVADHPATAEPQAPTLREARDWFSASDSSAAGHLVDTLFGDPALAQLGPEEDLPGAWIKRAQRLLSLQGDHGGFSLVRFARYLGWLHIHAAAWAEEHIVSAMLLNAAGLAAS